MNDGTHEYAASCECSSARDCAKDHRSRPQADIIGRTRRRQAGIMVQEQSHGVFSLSIVAHADAQTPFLLFFTLRACNHLPSNAYPGHGLSST